MTWVLTIISLVGNYLNCKKMVACFYLWIMCNIGWGFVDLTNGMYSRLMLDIVQTAFAVYGVIEWKRKSND